MEITQEDLKAAYEERGQLYLENASLLKAIEELKKENLQLKDTVSFYKTVIESMDQM